MIYAMFIEFLFEVFVNYMCCFNCWSCVLFGCYLGLCFCATSDGLCLSWSLIKEIILNEYNLRSTLFSQVNLPLDR